MLYFLIRIELRGESKVYLYSLESSGEINVFGLFSRLSPRCLIWNTANQIKINTSRSIFVPWKLFPQSKYVLKHSIHMGTDISTLYLQTEPNGALSSGKHTQHPLSNKAFKFGQVVYRSSRPSAFLWVWETDSRSACYSQIPTFTLSQDRAWIVWWQLSSYFSVWTSWLGFIVFNFPT